MEITGWRPSCPRTCSILALCSSILALRTSRSRPVLAARVSARATRRSSSDASTSRLVRWCVSSVLRVCVQEEGHRKARGRLAWPYAHACMCDSSRPGEWRERQERGTAARILTFLPSPALPL